MIDIAILRNLVPLNNLTGRNLERLSFELTPEQLPKGAVLFREGDGDHDACYLLEGGVEIVSERLRSKRVLQAGTPDAAFALAPVRPRDATATAMTAATILRIDSRWLDQLTLFDEYSTVITSIRGVWSREFSGDTKWLEDMMQNGPFRHLPEDNRGPLVMKLEPVNAKAGDVVVKQGEPGRFYYIIKEGRFAVTRQSSDGRAAALAELGPGQVFGEESLITGEARNASVVAITAGTLMRLPRADFDELLKKPLLDYVEPGAAAQQLQAGAVILDVRRPEEFRQGALKGSVNLPLGELRAKLPSLDRDKPYIVACRTGVQSEVAAFLMRQEGLRVAVLHGGLQRVADEKARR
jgi:CRP-like cAMP-binding protein